MKSNIKQVQHSLYNNSIWSICCRASQNRDRTVCSYSVLSHHVGFVIMVVYNGCRNMEGNLPGLKHGPWTKGRSLKPGPGGDMGRGLSREATVVWIWKLGSQPGVKHSCMEGGLLVDILSQGRICWSPEFRARQKSEGRDSPERPGAGVGTAELPLHLEETERVVINGPTNLPWLWT